MSSDLSRGLRKCPNCGSKRIQREPVEEELIVVHKPRSCLDCGHAWLPRPSCLITPFFLGVGTVFFAIGLCSLGLALVWFLEWRDDGIGLDMDRLNALGMMFAGAVFGFILGVKLLLFGYSLLVHRRSN